MKYVFGLLKKTLTCVQDKSISVPPDTFLRQGQLIRKNSYFQYFFILGHGSDFLLISMKEGGVSLTVSMESGQLDTAIKVSEYTVKRVDEVVRHPHLVTQDQNTQVSNKFFDIPVENLP